MDGSGGLCAVAAAAASAGLGREGAGAEGLPREVAVDGVAAARVHAAARVRRRAAPAPLAYLERLVPHRLRRRRRRQRHRPRPVHHAPHGDDVLLRRLSFLLAQVAGSCPPGDGSQTESRA
jgi:hypothetical protein